jgi:hypothetical protein
VIIVKELDVNQARMKNPVAFVRVQEKVKTTSTVNIFIYFQWLNRVNASVSRGMFLKRNLRDILIRK